MSHSRSFRAASVFVTALLSTCIATAASTPSQYPDIEQRISKLRDSIRSQLAANLPAELRSAPLRVDSSESEVSPDMPMAGRLTIKTSTACSNCMSSMTLSYTLNISYHREKEEYGGGYSFTTDYYVGQVVKNGQCLSNSVVFWVKMTVTGGGQPSTVASAAVTAIHDGEVSVEGTSYVDPKGSTFTGDFFGVVQNGGSQCWAANHNMTISQ